MALLSKPRPVTAEDRSSVVELVSVLMSGENPRPRLDFARLSEDDARQLVELSDRVRAGDLPRDDARFLRLVAVAADFDSDHFQKRAEAANAARKAFEREARERRMPFGKRETRNLFLALFEALEVEDLWLDDVVTMVAVLCQLVAGKPLISSSAIEGSAATGDLALVVNANIGLVGVADGSNLTLGWKSRTKYLSEEGWLEISGRGPIQRLTLGPRLRELVDLEATP
jgi:hypothetical protein